MAGAFCRPERIEDCRLIINVRTAKLEDAVGVATVHIASWRETYYGIVPDDFLNELSLERRTAQWTNSLSNLDDEYHRAFVAELDGQIVGFANYGFVRESDPLHQGELFAIYVLQSVHKRGVGGMLVSAIAQGLLDLGVSSMLVWVLRENPARGFYERLGGRYLREKMIEIGGRELPEIAYGWQDVKILQRG